jgi:3-hydroxyisobutyrate dehydrogenase-like beta-hydroxyacid dehydrogenase
MGANGGNAQQPVIGIAGLGFVGRALAARAREQGWSVIGCDPHAPAATLAGSIGVRVLPGVAPVAAACDVLLVCVLDDPQLAAVIDAVVGAAPKAAAEVAAEAPAGAVPAALASRGPGLVVNAVTCSPAAADRTVAQLRACGVDCVEMPMQGDALGLIGADAAVWGRHRACLQRLVPRLMHVGPPGAATRAKLASNLVLGLNRSALAEGLALATALGLDGEVFLQLLRESPAYSRAVDVAGPRMLARDFTPVSRLSQHRKDLRLILEAGEAAGLALPLAHAQAQLLERAVAAGLGELDNVAVIDALRPGFGAHAPRPAT